MSGKRTRVGEEDPCRGGGPVSGRTTPVGEDDPCRGGGPLSRRRTLVEKENHVEKEDPCRRGGPLSKRRTPVGQERKLEPVPKTSNGTWRQGRGACEANPIMYADRHRRLGSNLA